jgi:hypothetical protein
MFDDEKEWPVRCPCCGALTPKKIGWLKVNTRLTCGGCGAVLRYYREKFTRDLEDAENAIDSFSRGLIREK